MKGLNTELILLIGGLLLVFFAFLYGTSVYPMARYGQCWGSFTVKINNEILPLMNQVPLDTEIVMDDCVGFLYFKSNPTSDDLEKINKKLEKLAIDNSEPVACPQAPSIVLGMPYFEYQKWGLNPFDWPEAFWDDLVEIFREDIRGIKPFCTAVDKPFNPGELSIVGPLGKGTKTVVIHTMNKGDAIEISCEGSCGE
ncbi:MAG: hypothetical protein ABIF92_00140 [archaeon]